MTLIVSEHRSCGHCGRRTRYAESLGGAVCGDTALDFRLSAIVGEAPPSDMVHRCEHCGYCWPDIQEPSHPRTQGILESEGYRQLLADAGLPEVARNLRAQALLQRELGQWARAALSMLGAAWAMDDAAHDRARAAPGAAGGADAPAVLSAAQAASLASAFRDEAVALLQQAHELGQTIQAEPDRDQVMLVDMLRRCGRFDEAVHLARALLSPGRGYRWNVQVADGIRLGWLLAAAGSTRCASFRQAVLRRREAGGQPVTALAGTPPAAVRPGGPAGQLEVDILLDIPAAETPEPHQAEAAA